MRVIIIRHFKVQHTWKRCCTSVEFDEECRLYDKAPIERTKNKEIYDVKNVYISNLDRSLQTAKALFGDMDYCRTELIGEVPLRSAFDTKYRFPLWFWNVAGRMQWLFGCKRQPESRNGTKERALRFVHELTLRDDDCAIVTHGFFMHTLIRVMKKQGFTEGKNMLHYDNGEAVIFYGI